MDAGAGAHRKTKWLLAGTEFDDGNIVVLSVEKAQCQILSVGRERGRIIGIGSRKIDKRHWRRRRRICCRRDQIKQNQPELLHDAFSTFGTMAVNNSLSRKPRSRSSPMPSPRTTSRTAPRSCTQPRPFHGRSVAV